MVVVVVTVVVLVMVPVVVTGGGDNIVRKVWTENLSTIHHIGFYRRKAYKQLECQKVSEQL